MTIYSGTVINSSLDLNANDSAVEVTVGPQGNLQVYEGAEVYWATVKDGRVTISGGCAYNTYIKDSGCVKIYNGGNVYNTIAYGGSMYLYSRSTAEDTIIDSGAYLYISGGNIYRTVMSGKGYINIYSGGTCEEATLNSGSKIYVSSGGYASKITINSDGSLAISRDGYAKNVIINSGGYLAISSNGFAEEIIASRGRLGVAYGGSASNVQLIGAGSSTVNEGGVLTQVEIVSGHNLNVISRGYVYDAVVDSLGHMWVEDGGLVKDSIIKAGNIYVTDSGCVENIIVSSGAVLDVNKYSSAGSITVLSGGVIDVDEYSTADNITVESGGIINNFTCDGKNSLSFTNGAISIGNAVIEETRSAFVYSGGMADSVLINTSGCLTIYDGAKTSAIVASGAKLNVHEGGFAEATVCSGSIINGFIVSNDSSLKIDNGAANLSNVETTNSMDAYIYNGGVVNGLNVVSSYANSVLIYSGGSASNVDISGSLMISGGAAVSNAQVHSLGGMYVYSGAIASNVDIASGGAINGFYLRNDSHFDLIENGVINISGADVYMRYIATLWDSATADDLFIQGILVVSSGGVARDISAIGELKIESGGTVEDATIWGLGEIEIAQGGNTKNLLVSSGCRINGFTLWNDEYFDINNGEIYIDSANVRADYSWEPPSSAWVSSGSFANNIVVEDSGILSVYDRGEADNVTVMNMGSACIYSGGTIGDSVVSSGAYLWMYDDSRLDGSVIIASGGKINGITMTSATEITERGFKIIVDGGIVKWDSAFAGNNVELNNISVDYDGVLTLNAGCVANDITLLENGEVLINSGATVNVLANSGGILTISSGGVLNNYIHSGYSDKIVVESGAKINGLATERFGGLEISGGGEVNDAQINTGIISIYGGVINGFDNDGSIWLYSGAVIKDGIMRSSMSMLQGTSASNINITKGGKVNVYDGATIQDVVLNGVMTIWEGGSGAQIILKDNAFLSVSNDAYISNLIVESGGFAHVCQGEDILIKDGGMLSVGGTEEGIKDITLAGGSMELFAMNPLPIRCDSITFELSGEMPNAMINADISKVTCSQYYLSVAEGNSSQEYILCSNSNGFSQSITVINSSGDELGALKVGETLSTNYGEYSLTEADGKLLLSYNATVINEAVSGLTATIKSAEELAAGDSLTLTSVNYTVSDSQIGVFSATNGVLDGGAANVTGNVAVTVTSTSGDGIGALYGGGLGLNQSIGEDVLLTLESGVYGYIYAGGYSAVSGNVKTVIGDVTVNNNIYGGTAYTNPDSFINNVGGSTTVEISSGVILNQVYAGNYVNCDNSGGEVKSTVSGGSYLNISGGTFTGPVVMAGGVGVATGSGSSYVISEVNGGTHVNVTGGEIAYLYGGGRGGASTVNADYGASVVNDGSHITIAGGDIKVVYGGGYCDAGYSYVNGGASITLNAGTIGTVFGGGSGTGGAARNSIVDNVNITVDATGDLSIADIYGGGNGRAQVSGDVTITLHGSNGHNLSINGLISGGGRNGVSGVGGDRTLQFEDYQGSLDATIVNFNTIRVNEYTEVALSKVQDFSTVDTFIFDAPMQTNDTTAGMLLSGDTVWGGSKLLKLNVDSGVYDAEIVLLSNLGNDISSFADANYEFNVLGTLEDGYSSGVMSGIDLESGLGSAWYNEIDEAYYRLEIGEFDTLAGLDLRLKVIDAYSDEGLQLKAQLA